MNGRPDGAIMQPSPIRRMVRNGFLYVSKRVEKLIQERLKELGNLFSPLQLFLDVPPLLCQPSKYLTQMVKIAG
jgi:hypothetical protein